MKMNSEITEIIFLSFMIIMNIMFCLMKHPMSIGFILMIQTILTTSLIGMMMWTFWFSYIMFLILIGALIVLFIYMTSLTPNKKFKFNKNLMWYFILMIIFFIILFNNDLFTLIKNHNNDMINISNKIIENNNLSDFSLMNIFNKFEYKMTLILINYLLFTLFIIVKIININKGTMRKMN